MANSADHSNISERVKKLLDRLLSPLTRLCLANGVTVSTVYELLKQSFVREANALHPEAPLHGSSSRISNATGLTRREVTRIMKLQSPLRRPKPSIAAELFARWSSDPIYQLEDGKPAAIRRIGASPSFEALASSATRDLHFRSMLDEMIRLGVVLYNAENDTVSLARNEFVPSGDKSRMLDLLSDNVGDHLTASVENVLGNGDRHLEQAVFADELSCESVEKLKKMAAEEWKRVRSYFVSEILSMIESDRAAGRLQDQRVRIGIYTFDESAEKPEETPEVSSQPGKRKYLYKESDR